MAKKKLTEEEEKKPSKNALIFEILRALEDPEKPGSRSKTPDSIRALRGLLQSLDKLTSQSLDDLRSILVSFRNERDHAVHRAAEAEREVLILRAKYEGAMEALAANSSKARY